MNNNYKYDLSMSIKDMYMNLNTQVQDMDNKFKELYNNTNYTQGYKQSQHFKMKQAINKLHQETNRQALEHLQNERIILEQQQKDMFNANVDKMDRLYNLMLFSIAPERAIQQSIEHGDIANAITLLEVSKDTMDIKVHMELENEVYSLTNTSEIQHIDTLINKLSYHNSDTGIVNDIILNHDTGEVIEYDMYVYKPIDSYQDTPTDIF